MKSRFLVDDCVDKFSYEPSVLSAARGLHCVSPLQIVYKSNLVMSQFFFCGKAEGEMGLASPVRFSRQKHT